MPDDEEQQEEQEASAVPTDSREHLDLKTHAQINQNLCGFIEDIQDGYAKVRLVASEEMVVDKRGMIHAGFLFSAASFAAIAAINKPNVVLVVARCNFLAALKVEDEVIFEAKAMQNTARKRAVTVEGTIGKIKVFDGEFSAVVTDRHTLSLNLIDE